MYIEKRYQGTDRDENGKLRSVLSYHTLDEFDRDIEQWPPAPGHTVEIFDTWEPLDCFGLFHKVVREIHGV